MGIREQAARSYRCGCSGLRKHSSVMMFALYVRVACFYACHTYREYRRLEKFIEIIQSHFHVGRIPTGFILAVTPPVDYVPDLHAPSEFPPNSTSFVTPR